jgi:general secretion pathway protein G
MNRPMPRVVASRSPSRGFTLVELLAVLAILALLVAMAMPMVELTARRDRESDLKQALWEIRDAIDAYKRMSDAGLIAPTPSGYPPNLQVLVDGVTTSSSTHVYFLRRLPVDPFADESARGGWGLRSYASSAEHPQAGSDVYDVYSTSTLTGLNGVALRNW